VNLVHLKLVCVGSAGAALDYGGVDDEVNHEVAAENQPGEGMQPAKEEASGAGGGWNI
jgi:hypothetical protein